MPLGFSHRARVLSNPFVLREPRMALRAGTITGLGLSIGLLSSAGAADLVTLNPLYAPPVQATSFVSELRIGGSAQDPWSAEKGSGNVNGEVLFGRPLTLADRFWNTFVPRPTAGFSLNTTGRTSYAYAGVTWTFDVTDRIFADGFFGGAVHNGATGPKGFIPPRFNALGCSPLFREAGALGYRLTSNLSVIGTIEHMSNAGLCVENRGLTNVGLKIGYSF